MTTTLLEVYYSTSGATVTRAAPRLKNANGTFSGLATLQSSSVASTIVGVGAYTAVARGSVASDQVLYVNPASGASSTTGTQAAPFKTVAQLNAASKPAGTVIYLKRGTTLTGNVSIGVSGTPSLPITFTAYGTGAQPIITSNQSGDPLALSGSWIDVVGVRVSNAAFASIVVSGADCSVRGCTITASCAGVQVTGARAKLIGNSIIDNNRMNVNTPSPTNDDSGAFGVLLNTGANNCEVAFNTISGHLASSFDYGYDGCAVEVYGGNNNSVHHNIAEENETFCELGSPNTTGNSFTYNVIRASAYAAAKCLVTRGSQDTFGPVLDTTFSRNSVYLTGAQSAGIVAYANAGQNIITVQYNAIRVAGQWAFVDDSTTHTEDHNVFLGQVNRPLGASSVQADPKFVSTTNLRLQVGSPAAALGAGAYDVAASVGPDPSPVGVPGSWTLAFRDEFDGTSLDSSKWSALVNTQNNVTTSAANVSVANSIVTLVLSDSATGAEISTSTLDGRGVKGFEAQVGDYTEARVYFPGDSADPIWNWPAWWQSDAQGTWPVNGEIDIAEGLSGRLTANYHSGTVPNNDTGVNNSGPIGASMAWTNTWHTYGAHRKAATVDYYWDGALVRTITSSDAGGGHTLILNIGKSNSRTLHTGDSGGLKCDYVRAWRPAAGGTSGIAAMGNPAVTEIASGSGSIVAIMPTSIASGEVLIATVSCTIGDVVAPSGWTLIPGTQAKGGDTAGLSTQGYYRVATGTNATSYTWTGVGTSRASVIVQRFSGVNTATPFDVEASSGHTPDSQTGTSYVVPSITTITPGAVFITGASVNAASAAILVIPPGYATRGASTGTGRGAALASIAQTTAGSSGAVPWVITPTTTTLQINAWLAALRPA